MVDAFCGYRFECADQTTDGFAFFLRGGSIKRHLHVNKETTCLFTQERAFKYPLLSYINIDIVRPFLLISVLI